MPRNTDVNIEYVCPKCEAVVNYKGKCPECGIPLRWVEGYDEDPLFPDWKSVEFGEV